MINFKSYCQKHIHTGNNHIKLGDFGISRQMKVASYSLTPDKVTFYYMSPEMRHHQTDYTYKTDIWLENESYIK